MNFEIALNELETLVAKMETGQLSLEEALISFEQGVKLSRQCQNTLKEAEQKVQILTQNKTGEDELANFNSINSTNSTET